MKMAMKDGYIHIMEANSTQFAIIKSWGKMKWNRATQIFGGPVDMELLNRLSEIISLPKAIEKERIRLNKVMEAVDKERMNPNPIPIIEIPIKVKPLKHQIRGYNMALITLGLVDPPQQEQDDEKSKQGLSEDNKAIR